MYIYKENENVASICLSPVCCVVSPSANHIRLKSGKFLSTVSCIESVRVTILFQSSIISVWLKARARTHSLTHFYTHDTHTLSNISDRNRFTLYKCVWLEAESMVDTWTSTKQHSYRMPGIECWQQWLNMKKTPLL